MDTYITSDEIEELMEADEGVNSAVLLEISKEVSELIDLYCEVPRGFFGVSSSVSATNKIFYGRGINQLRISPFKSISSVTIGTELLDVDDYRIIGDYAKYILRTDGGIFADNQKITVSAVWGFAKVPAIVKGLVRELTIYSFRQTDPLHLKKAEVDTELIKSYLSPNSRIKLEELFSAYSTNSGFA